MLVTEEEKTFLIFSPHRHYIAYTDQSAASVIKWVILSFSISIFLFQFLNSLVNCVSEENALQYIL